MQTRSTIVTGTPTNLNQLLLNAGYSAADIASMPAVVFQNKGSSVIYFSEGTTAQSIENSFDLYGKEWGDAIPPYNEVWLRSHTFDTPIVFKAG
ncbi:hypothetical protein [Francisella marina]|uniref:Uncharacterized protein n=1 Tax=Francisella marina TaxID=2249302 RepID=A0ABX5ZGH8_9GAMM|nr:hypothetical protein [Francisella marina]QEO57545.1 hypothetical protein F0R74_06655 [Francisella marina]